MSNAALDIIPSSSYGLRIYIKNNEDLTCTSLPLTADISIAYHIPQDHTPVTGLLISMIPSRDIGADSGIVLDTDSPAMEIIIWWRL